MFAFLPVGVCVFSAHPVNCATGDKALQRQSSTNECKLL